MYIRIRERTEVSRGEAKAREEELRKRVEDLETAKKEVEESLELHLEEASQQVNTYEPLHVCVYV